MVKRFNPFKVVPACAMAAGLAEAMGGSIAKWRMPLIPPLT